MLNTTDSSRCKTKKNNDESKCKPIEQYMTTIGRDIRRKAAIGTVKRYRLPTEGPEDTDKTIKTSSSTGATSENDELKTMSRDNNKSLTTEERRKAVRESIKAVLNDALPDQKQEPPKSRKSSKKSSSTTTTTKAVKKQQKSSKKDQKDTATNGNDSTDDESFLFEMHLPQEQPLVSPLSCLGKIGMSSSHHRSNIIKHIPTIDILHESASMEDTIISKEEEEEMDDASDCSSLPYEIKNRERNAIVVDLDNEDSTAFDINLPPAETNLSPMTCSLHMSNRHVRADDLPIQPPLVESSTQSRIVTEGKKMKRKSFSTQKNKSSTSRYAGKQDTSSKRPESMRRSKSSIQRSNSMESEKSKNQRGVRSPKSLRFNKRVDRESTRQRSKSPPQQQQRKPSSYSSKNSDRKPPSYKKSSSTLGGSSVRSNKTRGESSRQSSNTSPTTQEDRTRSRRRSTSRSRRHRSNSKSRRHRSLSRSRKSHNRNRRGGDGNRGRRRSHSPNRHTGGSSKNGKSIDSSSHHNESISCSRSTSPSVSSSYRSVVKPSKAYEEQSREHQSSRRPSSLRIVEASPRAPRRAKSCRDSFNPPGGEQRDSFRKPKSFQRRTSFNEENNFERSTRFLQRCQKHSLAF